MEKLRKQEVRGFLVGLDYVDRRGVLGVEESLEELAQLADTANIHVVGQAYQRVKHPDPATFIRSGKVEEVRAWVEELAVDIVIFDDELSPRHQRELEQAFGENVQVLDRTALILDIFAQHARTREGALQVELAQYEYRLPRLTRQWTHLARQAGGGRVRGGIGGVGLRGPGETQLETDRREIRRRIARLRRDLEDVRAHRERYRAQRRRAGVPVVALVGYTNAGKSTLLNRLSGASVYVADKLFATLDPTTRRVRLPSGSEALFTDTVGFIQKLPHSLIAAFRATLEEIADASLLIYVIDVSHSVAMEHLSVVERTLAEDLEIRGAPCCTVLNKIDLIESAERAKLDRLSISCENAVAVSALRGEGIDDLLKIVDQILALQLVRIVVRIPYSEPYAIARFHEHADVQAESYTEEYVELVGMIASRYLSGYRTYRVEE